MTKEQTRALIALIVVDEEFRKEFFRDPSTAQAFIGATPSAKEFQDIQSDRDDIIQAGKAADASLIRPYGVRPYGGGGLPGKGAPPPPPIKDK